MGLDSQITPTPHEIVRRLGARSPSHELDRAELTALYDKHRDLASLRLKRTLWAKLLTTALGTSFTDEDDLFVEHTLLVNTGEILAHAIVGIDPTDPSIGARTLLEGALFADAQIANVVEADFFDWVAEIDPEGEQFVKTLARRLSRFDWSRVEHDVMKVLYESVISAQTRHSLGEYYTPAWLADEIVSSTVVDPLQNYERIRSRANVAGDGRGRAAIGRVPTGNRDKRHSGGGAEGGLVAVQPPVKVQLRGVERSS